MKLKPENLLFLLAVMVTLASTESKPEDEELDQKKRGGKMMRYGRGETKQYAKRSSIMRYGRSNELDQYDALQNEQKRLFRYGKRDDEEETKRRVFRYGKRTEDSTDKRGSVFRYGKRAGVDDLIEEAKRRIMRYGREIRDAQEPHVPFRFGEE